MNFNHSSENIAYGYEFYNYQIFDPEVRKEITRQELLTQILDKINQSFVLISLKEISTSKNLKGLYSSENVLMKNISSIFKSLITEEEVRTKYYEACAQQSYTRQNFKKRERKVLIRAICQVQGNLEEAEALIRSKFTTKKTALTNLEKIKELTTEETQETFILSGAYLKTQRTIHEVREILLRGEVSQTPPKENLNDSLLNVPCSSDITVIPSSSKRIEHGMPIAKTPLKSKKASKEFERTTQDEEKVRLFKEELVRYLIDNRPLRKLTFCQL